MIEEGYWISPYVHGLEPVWQKVTKEQWVSAERSAGFRNTMGKPDEPATGGFSGGGLQGTRFDPFLGLKKLDEEA